MNKYLLIEILTEYSKTYGCNEVFVKAVSYIIADSETKAWEMVLKSIPQPTNLNIDRRIINVTGFENSFISKDGKVKVLENDILIGEQG